jgi:hypothetical protein
MAAIIKDTDFSPMAKSIKPDAKKRVVLPKALVKEDVVYNIYTNSLGQIILDPQVTIPASELWLFQNKEALASVDKGMVESTSGKVINRGSFAKYVKKDAA